MPVVSAVEIDPDGQIDLLRKAAQVGPYTWRMCLNNFCDQVSAWQGWEANPLTCAYCASFQIEDCKCTRDMSLT
jgi:hypothetical protein